MKFVVLPSGLSSGYIVMIYFDVIFVIEETYEKCLISTITNTKFFLKLCFIIHPEKNLLTTFTRNDLPRICFFLVQRKCWLHLPVKKGK